MGIEAGAGMGWVVWLIQGMDLGVLKTGVAGDWGRGQGVGPHGGGAVAEAGGGGAGTGPGAEAGGGGARG